jgi:signal transduction histidine kinase
VGTRSTAEHGLAWAGQGHGDQGCELLVSNHGPAPAPHTLDQMFNRFYRADDARQSAGGPVQVGMTLP